MSAIAARAARRRKWSYPCTFCRRPSVITTGIATPDGMHEISCCGRDRCRDLERTALEIIDGDLAYWSERYDAGELREVPFFSSPLYSVEDDRDRSPAAMGVNVYFDPFTPAVGK